MSRVLVLEAGRGLDHDHARVHRSYIASLIPLAQSMAFAHVQLGEEGGLCRLRRPTWIVVWIENTGFALARALAHAQFGQQLIWEESSWAVAASSQLLEPMGPELVRD